MGPAAPISGTVKTGTASAATAAPETTSSETTVNSERAVAAGMDADRRPDAIAFRRQLPVWTTCGRAARPSRRPKPPMPTTAGICRPFCCVRSESKPKLIRAEFAAADWLPMSGGVPGSEFADLINGSSVQAREPVLPRVSRSKRDVGVACLLSKSIEPAFAWPPPANMLLEKSVRHQAANRTGREQLARHTPEDPLPEAAVSVSTRDQQIGALLPGDSKQLLGT